MIVATMTPRPANTAEEYTPGTLLQPWLPGEEGQRINGMALRAARVRRGRTRESVAAAMGISLGTLHHWENGNRQPLPAFQRMVIEFVEELNQRVRTGRPERDPH